MSIPDPQRLTRVEEKLAHLEHHLGELDGVVREAFGQIAAVRQALEKLRTSVEADAPDEPTSSEDEKPPHW